MLKKETWLIFYHRNIDWVLRRLEPDTLEFYKDKAENWYKALQFFREFEDELYKRYFDDKKQNFKISNKQWFTLCHKYIDKARENDDWKSADLIFQFWNDISHYFPEHKHLVLCIPTERFTRRATKKEIEFANKNLIPDLSPEGKEAHKNTIWYNDTAQVLTYRGLNAMIDSVWNSAHILDEDGKVLDFSLDWDWWYPIDRYLDLNKGWKKHD